MLLEAALTQYRPCQAFLNFSRKDHSEENLEFLLLVSWVNPALGKAAINIFPRYCNNLLQQIKYVYEYYVQEESKKQVNLSSVCRKEVDAAYAEASRAHLRDMGGHKKIFDNAYKHILNLTRGETWKRFCDTPEGHEVGADVDESQPNAPAALRVPPPIVFNAPAPVAAVVNAPAAAAPQPLVQNYSLPVPPLAGAARRALVRSAVQAAENNRRPLPPTPAAVAHPAAVVNAPARAAVAAPSGFRRPVLPNQSAPIVAKGNVPLPPAPPLPPIFIVPPESLPTRPRANAQLVIIVRQQG
jgi:hypothetical protein